jgi:protein-S-isoprenylcysteine O-methyltransferase Ste14
LALVYGGVALRTNAGWAAALLPAALLVVRRGVIDREERYLEGRFGEPYREYRARVRRWA